MIIKLYLKHMSAIPALKDVNPEVNRTTPDGKYSSQDDEVCNFLSCLFNEARECRTGNFHIISSLGM